MFEQTGRLDVISPVWSIPATENKKDGRFNVTISFPDGALAVVSDGCEALYIVKTGDRKSSEPWNVSRAEHSVILCHSCPLIFCKHEWI